MNQNYKDYQKEGQKKIIYNPYKQETTVVKEENGDNNENTSGSSQTIGSPFFPKGFSFPSFSSAQPYQKNQDSNLGKSSSNSSSTNSNSSVFSASSASISSDENSSFCEDDEPGDSLSRTHFKLPSSKSPVIETMAYCAVRQWGVSIVTNTPETMDQKAAVVLLVSDFGQYYRFSRTICSKQHPTKDLGARVKALRRWFVHFPKKKERKENSTFYLEVKPSCARKVHEIINKYLAYFSGPIKGLKTEIM